MAVLSQRHGTSKQSGQDGETEESHLCDINLFCLGKAGTATSAMSEKVRTRLEELDDFEEVSESFAESQEQ